MSTKHWSDCALHSGPARWPHACDCGGVKDDTQFERASYRLGYIPVAALENILHLWSARLVWLRESHASPLRSLQRVASRIASGRHRCRSLEREVQHGAADRRS
jgi:hypothetical protein